MNIRSTRHAVWFGLLAGSLAIAPAAQAQIQITGGNTSGQAAFFVPGEDAAGNVRLFDVGLRTLRIETPNGVTTTSVFIPGAANFTDVDQSGTPNAGDTGTLQGTLSGIAFSGANPIPFTGRATAINFTLDSFTNNIGNIEGTLIRPEQRGTAPLVFLPGIDNANVTLGDSGFLSDGGELQLGDFEATLDSGLIALPSSLQFREGTGTPVTPDVSLARRIKFEFAGRNVLAGEGTDLDLTDDSFRFVGPANHRFRIQSVGTRASREFNIRGDIGAVDVSVEGPFDVKRDGTIDTDLPIERYSVRGDSEGLVSFFDDSSVGFSSLDGGDTRIEFRQGDNRLEARSEGSVDFLAVAGIDGDTDDDFDDFDGFDFSRIDFRTVNVNVNQTCNVCVTTLVPGRTVVIDDNRVTVGQPIVVTREGRSTRTATTFTRTTRLVRVTTTSTDLFTLNTGSTQTARYQYGYLTGYRYFVIGGGDATVSRGQVVVRTISRGRNQVYVVTPSQSNQVLVAYSQVGPGSRIFPGLVGLREIASSDVVVDLDDLDDDTTEDLDLDDDFDSDDDDDDDDLDDLDDDFDGDDDDDDDLDDDFDSDDDDDDDLDDDDDDDDLDDDFDSDDDDDDDDDDSVTINESSETIVIEETSGITGLSEIADDDTTSTDATSPNE